MPPTGNCCCCDLVAHVTLRSLSLVILLLVVLNITKMTEIRSYKISIFSELFCEFLFSAVKYSKLGSFMMFSLTMGSPHLRILYWSIFEDQTHYSKSLFLLAIHPPQARTIGKGHFKRTYPETTLNTYNLKDCAYLY